MELRQLEYLAAVEEHGGFTAAARALFVAQPAVSHAIGKLEFETGLELVDRRARRLTEAGRLLAARGSRARAELSAAQSELAALKGLYAGSVHLGAIHWLAPFDLPDTLGRFGARHPGVALTLVEDDASAMLDRLQAGEIDLVIHHRSADTDRTDTARSVVVSEPIVLAVSRDDQWAERARVPLRAIADRPLVAFRSGSAYRRYLDDAARDRGAHLRVALESSDMAAIAGLVAKGLGVGLLPASLVDDRPDLVGIPTDPLTREVVLVWRTDHDLAPAARALRDLILGSEAGPTGQPAAAKDAQLTG